MPSFNKKDLKFVVTLANGKFGSSDNNQITLKGFRSSVQITNAGGNTFSHADCIIYGLKQEDINAMTVIKGLNLALFKNSIEIYAVEDDIEILVFNGSIINAWGDYNSPPDVFFSINAMSDFTNKIKAVPPTSFKGSVDVATVMELLANSMGYNFENNGVTETVSDIYLASTGLEQVKELAALSKIDVYLHNNSLAICPPGVPRGGVAPVISKDTGMIGYPTFDSIGVYVNTLFNRSVLFGGSIVIDSVLPQATGKWTVRSIEHRLDSNKPNGLWQSSIRATFSDLAVRSI